MNTAMIHLLLEHPERFTASEIPCSLLALWEVACDDAANEEITSTHPPAIAALRAPASLHHVAGTR